MADAEWVSLGEFSGRLEADMLQSYLQAYGIEVAYFQELVSVYGVGRIELFVPRNRIDEASELLRQYGRSLPEP